MKVLGPGPLLYMPCRVFLFVLSLCGATEKLQSLSGDALWSKIHHTIYATSVSMWNATACKQGQQGATKKGKKSQLISYKKDKSINA